MSSTTWRCPRTSSAATVGRVWVAVRTSAGAGPARTRAGVRRFGIACFTSSRPTPRPSSPTMPTRRLPSTPCSNTRATSEERPARCGPRDLVAIVITRGKTRRASSATARRLRHYRLGPSIPILARHRRSSSGCRVSSRRSWTIAWPPRRTRIVPLAFCGALSLQAVAGRPQGPRPWRQPHATSTVLAWPIPRSGKDWPRKVNTRVLHQVGLAESPRRQVRLGRGHPGRPVPHAEHAVPDRRDRRHAPVDQQGQGRPAREHHGHAADDVLGRQQRFSHAAQGRQGIAGRHRPAAAW